MNKVKGLTVLLMVALLVFFLTREAYRPDAATEQVSSTVLLERIRPVLKLVTVEGDFSELYTYRNAEAPMDWMKSFSPFQKKAILRVKGRASVGYDLDGMKLEFDETRKVVRMTAVGPPQLLSLEHDVDFYDLEAGSFTSFTAADHSRMQAHAKDLLRVKVAESGLFKAAAERKAEMHVVLRAVVEDAGWTVDDGAGTPLKD